jgi:hypothetical protein
MVQTSLLIDHVTVVVSPVATVNGRVGHPAVSLVLVGNAPPVIV